MKAPLSFSTSTCGGIKAVHGIAPANPVRHRGFTRGPRGLAHRPQRCRRPTGRGTDRRLGADRVWIVDPLDGTWEYGQGRADFAVHVALWSREAGTLTAEELLRFYARIFKIPRAEADRRIDELMKLVDLDETGARPTVLRLARASGLTEKRVAAAWPLNLNCASVVTSARRLAILRQNTRASSSFPARWTS